jgi:hypothetical protein
MARGRPELSISQILAWADFYHERTGKWPQARARQAVYNAVDEKWRNIDNALRIGLRGLPGKTSLARLLAQKRDVRNIHDLPRLSYKQILAWADAYHRRTGRWPRHRSGVIPEAPGDTWSTIHSALVLGFRGLPGHSSLARLLSDRRGVRNIRGLRKFTEKQILAWADRYRRRTGHRPGVRSGPIPGVPGETWMHVEMALRAGVRGLPGGSSLYRLLKKHGRI